MEKTKEVPFFKRTPDFLAEVTYLPESGRTAPAYSGYRPQVRIEGIEMITSGEQLFMDKEMVNPGETALAQIKLLSWQSFIKSLEPGMTFEFREGAVLIGTGKIIEVINPELIK